MCIIYLLTFAGTKGEAISYCCNPNNYEWLSRPIYNAEAIITNQGDKGQVRTFHKF